MLYVTASPLQQFSRELLIGEGDFQWQKNATATFSWCITMTDLENCHLNHFSTQTVLLDVTSAVDYSR